MNVLIRDSRDGTYPYHFGPEEGGRPSSRDLGREMSVGDFSLVLDYLSYAYSDRRVRLLGGEPTRHSRLDELLALAVRKGFSNVTFYSHGNLDEAAKTVLRKYRDVVSFSWNFRPYDGLSAPVRKNVEDSVREFSGPDSVASFHIHREDYDAAPVLAFLERHPQIRGVHVGISHPMGTPGATNANALRVHDYPSVGTVIHDFVRTLVTDPQFAHIARIGLHCGYVPCLWTPEQSEFLRSLEIFSFEECSPELADVLPDLSVRQCFVRGGDSAPAKLGDFAHVREAVARNAARFEFSRKHLPPASEKCRNCPDAKRCFGGCGGERMLSARLALAKLEFAFAKTPFWKTPDALSERGFLRAACGEYDAALTLLKRAATRSFCLFRWGKWMEITDAIDDIRELTAPPSSDRDFGRNLARIRENFRKERGKAVFDKELLSAYTATLVNAYFGWRFGVREDFSTRMARISLEKRKKDKDRLVSRYLSDVEWIRFGIDDPWVLFWYLALLRIARGDEAVSAHLDAYFEKNPQKEAEIGDLVRSLEPEGIIGDVTIDLLRKRFAS